MNTRFSMGRCASVCAVALTCCVPVEQVEVPDQVQWLAYVPTSESERFETGVRTGRLLPVEDQLLANAPGVNGWIVGFTTEALVTAGMPVDSLRDATVRRKGGCDFALPSPSWVESLGDAGDVPALTSDALAPDSRCRVPTTESFRVVSIELDRTADLFISSFGRAGDGSPLFSLSDGVVYQVAGQRVRYVGSFGTPLFSLAETNAGYFATDGRFLTGSAIETLVPRATASAPFFGHLVATNLTALAYVDVDGGRVAPIDGWLQDPPMIATGGGRRPAYFEDLQVIADGDGGIIAAGTGWSWRWDGVEFEHGLGIRKPFAVIDSTLVFGDDTGAIFAPVPASPQENRVIANVTEVRSTQYFVPIRAIVPYDGGAVVADELGYLTWFDLAGNVVQIAHLINKPKRVFVVGDDIVVISKDVDSQIFYSGVDTNVTVHILQRFD